jgi:hypothetical protein
VRSLDFRIWGEKRGGNREETGRGRKRDPPSIISATPLWPRCRSQKDCYARGIMVVRKASHAVASQALPITFVPQVCAGRESSVLCRWFYGRTSGVFLTFDWLCDRHFSRALRIQSLHSASIESRVFQRVSCPQSDDKSASLNTAALNSSSTVTRVRAKFADSFPNELSVSASSLTS